MFLLSSSKETRILDGQTDSIEFEIEEIARFQICEIILCVFGLGILEDSTLLQNILVPTDYL